MKKIGVTNTIRIYDAQFLNELNKLFEKQKFDNKNEFFVLLISKALLKINNETNNTE